MNEPDELLAATARWTAEDVEPADQSELDGLCRDARAGSAEALAELSDRMRVALAFGTAGLRAPLRAGRNGMNRAVVIRTTAGLAKWLADCGHSGGVVVVGRDARHGSEAFAHDAAAVLAAAGFDVHVLPEPLPTPVLAYATRALHAVAGVQITASHNPPEDNGYKVFLTGGAQLVTPSDTEIEAAITQIGGANSVPRKEKWTTCADILEQYLGRIAELPRGSARELRIAATALHGVGGEPLRRALHAAGFIDVRLVATQAEPDPEFPTVAFPNPEESGATDALLTLASEIHADLAIALDPDADRCALGVADHGEWRMLSGDEAGALLADHILSTMDADSDSDPLVATTIVSATVLQRLAAEHGVHYDETLTGFKWLMRAGDGEGTGLVYAYEEALGYCVDPAYVRDKDGISAATLACDLAATAKASGQTLPGLLDRLAVRHGVHATGQVSVRVSDLPRIAEMMRLLRANPPMELADVTVGSRDLLPRADVLVFAGQTAGGDVRVVVRPSGTEPKLKCYLQVVEHVDGDGLAEAKRRAHTMLGKLNNAVSELVRA